MTSLRPKAKLVLENGVVFTGRAFGAAEQPARGEVVFNTSITGYQEILTDPSYYGQIVVMTYPHIGNVGANHFDDESSAVQAGGLVVREASRIRSNWRSEENLEDYMARNNLPGIEGVDTRMLVRMIREEGAMRGVISAIEFDDAKLIAMARDVPSMSGLNLTGYVSCHDQHGFQTIGESGYGLGTPKGFDPNEAYHVVVMDYGVKRNILERLARFGCRLTIVPGETSADAIMALDPDGIFISNGPGDPDAVKRAIETVRALIGQRPIFGICLGHQLLALALGAHTYKMKFGHRGANHPVKNLMTGANEITSQNHGFAVDPVSLKNLLVDVTHINLNDQTIEGFRHRELPLFCVQYHPEASPGPHDADYLFAQFIEMMARERVEG